jgi:hypothetical protein
MVSIETTIQFSTPHGPFIGTSDGSLDVAHPFIIAIILDVDITTKHESFNHIMPNQYKHKEILPI